MRRHDREIHEKAEMADILQRGTVCHLALTDGVQPYIVALNYGYEWTETTPTLYFHCANSGKKLELLQRNNRGCCIVDIGHELVRGEKDCDWGMKYQSLVGFGSIEIVNDAAEKKKGLDLLMQHYSGRTDFTYDTKIFNVTTVLKMTLTEITGKKKV